MHRLFLLDQEGQWRWSGSSVTDDCARRLRDEGIVELMYTKGRVRGIRPLPIPKKPPTKRVIIRGPSVGKPHQDGATWLYGELTHKVRVGKDYEERDTKLAAVQALPQWLWHEVFYSVMNSCRTRPFEPWTWDEICREAKKLRKRRHYAELEFMDPVGRRSLCPPLKIAA